MFNSLAGVYAGLLISYLHAFDLLALGKRFYYYVACIGKLGVSSEAWCGMDVPRQHGRADEGIPSSPAAFLRSPNISSSFPIGPTVQIEKNLFPQNMGSLRARKKLTKNLSSSAPFAQIFLVLVFRTYADAVPLT